MSHCKIRIRTSSFSYLPGMLPRGPQTMRFQLMLGTTINTNRIVLFRKYYRRCFLEKGEFYANARTDEAMKYIALLTEKEAKSLWSNLIMDWPNAEDKLKSMVNGRGQK